MTDDREPIRQYLDQLRLSLRVPGVAVAGTGGAALLAAFYAVRHVLRRGGRV